MAEMLSENKNKTNSHVVVETFCVLWCLEEAEFFNL